MKAKILRNPRQSWRHPGHVVGTTRLTGSQANNVFSEASALGS